MTSTNQHQEYDSYENIEFNLATGQTDYDLAANQPTFLTFFGPESAATSTANGRYPSSIQIRTNATISVKLTSTSMHAITITSTDSPFTIVGCLIKNVYITNNSGSTAAIKILVTDNPN